jgi:hypothetical protein
MEPRVRIRPALHLVNKTLVHLPQALLVNITGVGSADSYEKGGYFCENHFISSFRSLMYSARLSIIGIASFSLADM